MSNRIEKTIELKAPVSRVWRALTDHREFGEWFNVKLDGPFVPGKVSNGRITYPGYEHLTFELVTQRIEPERRISFSLQSYAPQSKVYVYKGPVTLVGVKVKPKNEKTGFA